ncbi:hypothetical protein RSOLAG1IB_02815 [Rhizoctonia solani AG-1 IB]|uniref:Uncharacterized protein n=1 Tax=Thanatephorus cucumeris (strain AG1-IB / isolate 7/3/14) TaxID=1108050 RepID=A0A0B7FK85_THACB|nr:hypothetical protein RSOLAG1IB_02815 [Rhizoctonia solani AG-1 IB]
MPIVLATHVINIFHPHSLLNNRVALAGDDRCTYTADPGIFAALKLPTSIRSIANIACIKFGYRISFRHQSCWIH